MGKYHFRKPTGRPPVHGLTNHPLFGTWANVMTRWVSDLGIRTMDS